MTQSERGSIYFKEVDELALVMEVDCGMTEKDQRFSDGITGCLFC